ncbi:hypothetical protein NFI96_014236, partial [Prochilodus magdalenae]
QPLCRFVFVSLTRGGFTSIGVHVLSVCECVVFGECNVRMVCSIECNVCMVCSMMLFYAVLFAVAKAACSTTAEASPTLQS